MPAVCAGVDGIGELTFPVLVALALAPDAPLVSWWSALARLSADVLAAP